MTSGERMVWAAEFVRARGMGRTAVEAARMAAAAVMDLDKVDDDRRATLGHDGRAMFDDMRSEGANR